MEKLISIIIPMYNSEKTIVRCLNSILNQSYKNLEVIVINDGSDDEGPNIVSAIALKDERVKLINETNHGVSHARNVGLLKFTGDYVQFVDSDDDLDLDYFKIMTDLIEKNDADVAVCNNVHPYFYSHLDDDVFNLNNHDDFLRFYQHTFATTFPWNKLYKRDVVKGIYFEEDVFFAEDEVFACGILGNCKKIVSTNKVLYHYYYDKSGAAVSAMQKFLNSTKFWLNHTSLFYKELECLPAKLNYFTDYISNKLIPIDDISEVLYQRCADYTIYGYAAYVGSNVPEDALFQELTNVFGSTYFHKAINIQTKYGLEFIPFNDKNLEHYIFKLNRDSYKMFSKYFAEMPLDVNPNFCAGMLFAHYFITKNNDLNNINILNRLDKELKEGITPSAKFVKSILENR